MDRKNRDLLIEELRQELYKLNNSIASKQAINKHNHNERWSTTENGLGTGMKGYIIFTEYKECIRDEYETHMLEFLKRIYETNNLLAVGDFEAFCDTYQTAYSSLVKSVCDEFRGVSQTVDLDINGFQNNTDNFITKYFHRESVFYQTKIDEPALTEAKKAKCISIWAIIISAVVSVGGIVIQILLMK